MDNSGSPAPRMIGEMMNRISFHNLLTAKDAKYAKETQRMSDLTLRLLCAFFAAFAVTLQKNHPAVGIFVSGSSPIAALFILAALS